MVPFQTFSTADGRIVIACPKENLWRRLCEAIERPELADDERFCDFAARSRNRDELVELLHAELSRLPTAAWLARFEQQGVPCGAVNSVEKAFADPQAVARGALVEYEHPTLGEVRTMRTPFRLSTDETPAVRRGPYLGEHSDDVLREVCGYDDERIRSLRDAAVIGPLRTP
jgi:crotonobetainyl-CoA:carnitine CoA-transferase CaiB-like acyl-CoA transferase